MRVFITGASGFIGGALAKRLKQAGHTVSCMARSQQSIQKLQSQGFTTVECDLSNVDASHLSGMEVVVHSAAIVGSWASEADYFSTNVLGTQRLLDMSAAAAVPRFVFVGTEAACFDGSDLVNIDETAPYATHAHYEYTRTKAEAERRVLAANSASFTTLSIRPRLVWGPGDLTILPAVLQQVTSGQFAWLSGGQQLTSSTHIDNLVHALELALTKGRGGEAYFVSDDEVHTFKDFLTMYLSTQGVQVPDKSMPTRLVRCIAWLTETSWRLLFRGSAPPITRFQVDMFSASVTINISKAKRELGYNPVISVKEGMRAMQRLPSVHK
jgi:nucleoside-diphosphate-sugar epimerase